MTQQNTPDKALATNLSALPGTEVRQTDYAAKGYDLDVSLTSEALVPAVTIMDEAGYFLESITGVDWLGEQAALRKAAEAAEAAEAKARAEAQAKQEGGTKPEGAGEAVSAASKAAPSANADTGGSSAATDSSTGADPDANAAPAVKTAVDTAAHTPPPEAPLPEDEIEVVYDFNRFESRHRVVLRVRTPRSHPQVPTILDIYPIAHWHEREAHDFFGVVFTGHSYLVPLLLPEDADFHPLLKDYGA